MEKNWKLFSQLLLALTLSILFFWMLAPFLLAMFVAAVITIVCYPIYLYLRKYLNPGFSSLVVTLLITLGIALPISFVIYLSSYNLLNFASSLKLSPEDITEWIQNLRLDLILTRISSFIPVDEIWLKDQGIQILTNAAEKISIWVTRTLSSMPNFLLGVLVVLFSIFFYFKDGESLLKFLAKLSPLPPKRSVEIYKIFESSCRAVVVGLFASALAQGFLMMFFFAVTGLPNAPLFGMIGVGMGMVPVIGTVPIWLGAVIYLFVKVGIFKSILMLIGGILISSADNVVRAFIMKGKINMHPFLAVISTLGAVGWLGASGIFLGPIIAAIFLAVIKIISQEIQLK